MKTCLLGIGEKKGVKARYYKALHSWYRDRFEDQAARAA